MPNAQEVLEWMAWDKERKANMTNEEWFCQLSTEEKAKWLSQRSQILYDCGQRDVFPKNMYEEDWEYWLKEKHHE